MFATLTMQNSVICTPGHISFSYHYSSKQDDDMAPTFIQFFAFAFDVCNTFGKMHYELANISSLKLTRF